MPTKLRRSAQPKLATPRTKRATDHKPRKFTDLQRTAYHEAGHAVGALIRKIRFRYATIVPAADGTLGHMKLFKSVRIDHPVHPSERDRALDHITVMLAGPQVDRRLKSRNQAMGDHQGALALACRIAEQFYGGTSSDAAFREATYWAEIGAVRAQHLVAVNWSEIERLAEVLLVKRTLTEVECQKLFQPPSKSPRTLKRR